MKKLKEFIAKKVVEPVYHTGFVGFFRPGEEHVGDADHPKTHLAPTNDPLSLGKPAPDASAAKDDDEYKPFFVGFFRGNKKG